ncbi:MAG: glycosyltransferase [bacterium]|nr:glycosyltransferase [bacterium]
MKVLHLPVNVASIPYHTVKGLRQIGVDAKGLIFGEKTCQTSDGLVVIPFVDKNNFKKMQAKMLFSSFFFRMVKWADVIHWYFGSSILPLNIDIGYIKLLNKPAVVEWLGSDIRNYEIEFKDNPYYKRTFLCTVSLKQPTKSFKKQLKFARAGFITLVPPCMLQYVDKTIWNDIHIIRQRIMVSDYEPLYPESKQSCPIIVHAPTKPDLKGTPTILNTIEKLKKEYKFVFHLVQNVSHNETLDFIKKADIFVDQIIIGSHGMAALEAMAYGKPVVCYIKPSLIPTYPPDIPIVNANPDNLLEVLKSLILDSNLRYEIGKKSRDYVEKYHDAIKLAGELKKIYADVIKKRRKVIN